MALTNNQMIFADQLIIQGLTFWQQFASRKAANLLTEDDLNEAADKLDFDLEKTQKDIDAMPG